MKLVEITKKPLGNFDSDKLSRFCTTWVRTDQVCEKCGSTILRGYASKKPDRFACSGCPAVFENRDTDRGL